MQDQNTIATNSSLEYWVEQYVHALDNSDPELMARVLDVALYNPALDQAITAVDLAYLEEMDILSLPIVMEREAPHLPLHTIEVPEPKCPFAENSEPKGQFGIPIFRFDLYQTLCLAGHDSKLDPYITHPEQLYMSILDCLERAGSEMVVAIYLSWEEKLKIEGIVHLAEGDVAGVSVDLKDFVTAGREVEAWTGSRCHTLIDVHNHIDEHVMVSDYDKEARRALKEYCEQAGIYLLDSIIATPTSYYSFCMGTETLQSGLSLFASARGADRSPGVRQPRTEARDTPSRILYGQGIIQQKDKMPDMPSQYAYFGAK